MNTIHPSQIFSALPVRSFLKSLSYIPKNTDSKITWGLIFGTTASTIKARKNSHLTNATDKEHQIRFPLRDRVQRSLAKLANDVFKNCQHEMRNLTISIPEDDFISLEFFKALPNVQILTGPSSESHSLHLNAEELEILNWLKEPKEHLEQIIAKCHERIFASDYRAVYQILKHLPENLKNDSVHYMMGLCTNFFGETEESEISFRKMHKSKNPNSRVKAAYVTSMLYLRMHKKQNQSLEIAEDLLQTAYLTLSEHPEIEDWTFHRVFNRNGYALCLFRRGQVVEALEMLEWGIAELKKDLSGANRLHQSVLIYNAVQCLRTLGRFNDCEQKCAELLDIDPLFPEYHLEKARVYLEQEKTAQALRAIEKAETLDAFIPELFALKGFAHLQNQNLTLAARSYARALELKPNDQELKSDLDYCLSELEESQGVSA